MPEQNHGTERENIVVVLTASRSNIEEEWRSATVATADEAGAATNYYRGRADEWNRDREGFVRNDPRLEKDLPAALAVDEIVVRQRTQEQEQTQERAYGQSR